MRVYKKTLLSMMLATTILFGSACGNGTSNVNEGSTTKMESSTVTESKEETIDYNSIIAQLEDTDSPSFADFNSITMDGKVVDESIIKDKKLTMINVWATFCGYCIDEMPHLNELNQEYADQGFQVIGAITDVLNSNGSVIDSQMDLAKEIVAKTGVEYPTLLPTNDLIRMLLGGVSSVPATIFVDSDGNLVGDGYLGAKSKADWEKIIQEKLKEVQS